MSSKQRKQRILDGSIRMANDTSISDEERQVWIEKAKKLARQYDLEDYLNQWNDTVLEKDSTSKVRISGSSIVVHVDDIEWVEILGPSVADIFNISIVKSRLLDEDKELLDDDIEENEFYSYVFVGDKDTCNIASGICADVITSMYDMIDNGTMKENQIIGYTTCFIKYLRMRVEKLPKISTEIVLFGDQEKEKYIKNKWPVFMKRTVTIDESNSNISDNLKAEAYIRAKGVSV